MSRSVSVLEPWVGVSHIQDALGWFKGEPEETLNPPADVGNFSW